MRLRDSLPAYRTGSIAAPIGILLAGVLSGCQSNISGFMDRVPVLGGSPETDAEAVAAVMDDVYNGMRNKRIYKVLAHLSRDYADGHGRDYDAMSRFFAGLFDNYRGIRIDRGRPRVVVMESEARVAEAFGISANPMAGSDLIALNWQDETIVVLRKSDGQWRITSWDLQL